MRLWESLWHLVTITTCLPTIGYMVTQHHRRPWQVEITQIRCELSATHFETTNLIWCCCRGYDPLLEAISELSISSSRANDLEMRNWGRKKPYLNFHATNIMIWRLREEIGCPLLSFMYGSYFVCVILYIPSLFHFIVNPVSPLLHD